MATNFYKLLPPSLKPKVRNPAYGRKHHIELPFRAICVGTSGSMKTNWVLYMMQNMPDTWDYIVVCCANQDEPLYNFLKSKVPADQIAFYEGIEAVPPPEDIPGEQKIVIFDDLCLARNQRAIEEYYIRGRKLGISSIYITQSYFRCPSTIRKNCELIICKRVNTMSDLTRILSEYSLGINRHQLQRLYTYATDRPEDALLIDVTQRVFRKNLLERLQVI